MTTTQIHRGTAVRESDTTRLLCAAAYLDRTFADEVIRDVLEQEHRAVAPSYGVDLVPVVRHCLAAQHRRLALDAVLTLVVLCWPVLVVLGHDPLATGLGLALVGWGIVFTADCLERYQVLSTLLRHRFDPDAAPEPASRRHRRLIAELQRNEAGNVTVYSNFSPFVGAGLENEGWSFTTNLAKGKKDFTGQAQVPRPFEIAELYDSVRNSLRTLDIEGLSVGRRLFVNGQDVRDEAWVLPDRLARPQSVVDPRWLDHFLRTRSHRVRHYLVIQIVDWRGELVVSIFLRFARTGSCLVSEAAYFVLAPLKEKYHSVDEFLPAPDLRAAGKLFGRSLVRTPLLLVQAPIDVLERLVSRFDAWLRRRGVRRQMRLNPLFDYGAATSVRERGMRSEYRRYFQKLDHSAYDKIVEQCVLDAIIEFLDQHGIDTTDIEERQAGIMNNGVIVSGGGSIRAESLAVGKSARARAGGRKKSAGKEKKREAA